MERRGFGSTIKTRPMGPKQLLLVGAIFALVGLIMVVVAIAIALSSRAFYSTASQTTGVVTDVRRDVSHSSHGSSRSSSDSITYCPTVEFTVDGSRHRFEDHMCTSNDPGVGSTVTVAYQADNPESARIRGGRFHRYFGPLIAGPLGVLFGGIGVALMVFHRRSQPGSTGGAA